MNFDLQTLLQPLISVYSAANIGADDVERESLAYGLFHEFINELGELIGDTDSAQELLDGMSYLSEDDVESVKAFRTW